MAPTETQLAENILLVANGAASSDPATAKKARLFLEGIVHQYAAPNAPKNLQHSVAEALLTIAQDSQRPRMVRAHALRLLGFIGDKKHANALKPLLSDPQLSEDAHMATERITRN
jgi:hypothetical protein